MAEPGIAEFGIGELIADLPGTLMLSQSPGVDKLDRSLRARARLQELGHSADRRGIDAQGTLGRESQQVIRPARLEAGSRQSFAAEWLHADDGADHAAVDVDVADARAAHDAINEALHPAVNSERQAVAARADPRKRALEFPATEHADMQHRTEDLGSRQ